MGVLLPTVRLTLMFHNAVKAFLCQGVQLVESYCWGLPGARGLAGVCCCGVVTNCSITDAKNVEAVVTNDVLQSTPQS